MSNHPKDFINALQYRVANLSIGSSTLRSQGNGSLDMQVHYLCVAITSITDKSQQEQFRTSINELLENEFTIVDFEACSSNVQKSLKKALKNKYKNKSGDYVEMLFKEIYEQSNDTYLLELYREKNRLGMTAIARKHLANLNIQTFSSAVDKESFQNILNTETDNLIKKFFEVSPKNWGASRKVLNIFLRNVYYNTYLNKYYKFDAVKEWLEIPLDRHVGNGMQIDLDSVGIEPKEPFRQWNTIKDLTQQDSDYYQEIASRIAKKKGVLRVDLDVFYWRSEKRKEDELIHK